MCFTSSHSNPFSFSHQLLDGENNLILLEGGDQTPWEVDEGKKLLGL